MDRSAPVTGSTRGLGKAIAVALRDSGHRGRLGPPEDIGRVVAFLAGEGACFITEATIDVNGGQYPG